MLATVTAVMNSYPQASHDHQWRMSSGCTCTDSAGAITMSLQLGQWGRARRSVDAGPFAQAGLFIAGPVHVLD